jgi:hypothetical protein
MTLPSEVIVLEVKKVLGLKTTGALKGRDS